MPQAPKCGFPTSSHSPFFLFHQPSPPLSSPHLIFASFFFSFPSAFFHSQLASSGKSLNSKKRTSLQIVLPIRSAPEKSVARVWPRPEPPIQFALRSLRSPSARLPLPPIVSDLIVVSLSPLNFIGCSRLALDSPLVVFQPPESSYKYRVNPFSLYFGWDLQSISLDFFPFLVSE